jgi:hypothetical protein
MGLMGPHCARARARKFGRGLETFDLFRHGANESRLTDTFLGRTFEHEHEQEDDGAEPLSKKAC